MIHVKQLDMLVFIHTLPWRGNRGALFWLHIAQIGNSDKCPEITKIPEIVQFNSVLRLKSPQLSILPFGGRDKPFVTFVEALLLEVHTLGQVDETREVNILLLLIISESLDSSAIKVAITLPPTPPLIIMQKS